MTTAQSSDQLSTLKRAYLAIEKMEAKLKAVEEASREPIAIIGVGCRFPGCANDPQAFWKLLHDGIDAVVDVPSNRWDVDAYYNPDESIPGKMSTRQGGFLNDIDLFDPQFFGIAPREAVSLDPQQRLLLEVAWEALENAGQAPDKLSGTRTGVFIGIINNDYRQLEIQTGGLQDIDSYYSSGIAQSMASGRLSYVLGLQGPSISVDTACSSSLVSVHLACQSLRGKESNMALAGGVNLILTPELSVAFSKYQMLAPDGRCKTFDARADGFGRGEGCGLIVLKRLSDAVANGDNILALILGTAVNQDGPSSGLTAPNGPAQESVIRDALANAGMKPSQLTYIEAHGTGTSLGDPIELQALGSVLGERKTDQPLVVGSVKTNFGHLEAAAGIAGLIKTALALQHRAIPAHLHFDEPNPLVPWAELPIRVPSKTTAWPTDAPLAAGVSAFGFSGTNAHVILGAAPQSQTLDPQTERPAHLLKLSTKSESTLKALAGRFNQHLAKVSDADLADVCFSANVGRADLSHRLIVIAESKKEMLERLSDFVSSNDAKAHANGTNLGLIQGSDQPKIGFLFTGQGSQYPGMGKQLFETQPSFRQTVESCAEILRPYLRKPLLDVLFANDESNALIHETEYTQPALFVLEFALTELWRSWGIRPSIVMGHSIGEYVAACVASVFSLEDGLKLIAARGRLMQGLPAGGQMAAVFADHDRVTEAVQSHTDQISIAAINGPQHIVISGAGAALQEVLAKLANEGIRSRKLTVSNAFHSALMEPMLSEFEKIASEVKYSPPKIKIVSNVSGQLAMGQTMAQAAYWRDHVRRSVQFENSVKTMHAQGIKLFLETGPNPVLLEMGQRCLPENEEPLTWLPSLRRGRGDAQMMLQSLGELYTHGVEVDWAGFEKDYVSRRRRRRLPTSPFDRKRYWIKGPSHHKASHTNSGAIVHPLLGQRLRSVLKEIQFEAQVGADSFSFLRDHRVHGIRILPGAAYIEMGIAVAKTLFKQQQCELTDLIIQEPLVANEDADRTIQVVATPRDKHSANFQVFSLNEISTDGSDETWKLHASGAISVEAKSKTTSVSESIESIKERCSEAVTSGAHYQTLEELGLDFGPSLHGVQRIWRQPTGGEAIGLIHLPEEIAADSNAYHLHPALLDACLQVLSAALPSTKQPDFYMPVALDRFQVYGQLDPDGQVWSHAQIELGKAGEGSETYTSTVQLLNESGLVVASAMGLRLKRVTKETLLRSLGQKQDTSDWLYEVTWQPVSLPSKEVESGTWLTSPSQVAEVVQPSLAKFGKQPGVQQYQELSPQMNQFCSQYILYTLQQLGWETKLGKQFTADVLTKNLGIRDFYHPLIDRLLEILQEDGLLRRQSDQWIVDASIGEIKKEYLEARAAELLNQYPDFEAELTLLTRCGPRLSEVLTGTADPLELLFPGGDLTMPEKLYQESPLAHAYNGLIQEAVTKALEKLPAGQTLRVLEIGAGTGGTTASVLPHFPAEQTHYTFTDISPAFLAKAQVKFRDYAFIDYQALDIERSPREQGFEPHQYDLIVAANVIHATSNLRTTLQHVQQLLTPHGLLLMLEITSLVRWIDLTFGLTEGWWKFSDSDVRSVYPLLGGDRWKELLAEVGFGKTVILEPDSETQLDQALILAQVSAPTQSLPSPQKTWLILAEESGLGMQLAQRIRSRGDRCVLVSAGSKFVVKEADEFCINPERPQDFKHLFESIESPVKWDGVVHLWNLDATQTEMMDSASLADAQLKHCGSALYLVQAMMSLRQNTPPRLWLITRGVQALNKFTATSIAQAPIWGLAKTITLEHPELRCTMVDLDPADRDQSQRLFTEIYLGSPEEQVAVHQSGRYVARLTRYTPSPSTAGIDEKPRVLTSTARGILDSLSLQPATRRKPKPGEVEIRVYATGLNFKDVLIALDLYPGDPGPFGGECAGEITDVGENVTGFKVGDQVMGVAPGCFGTFVTASANLVVHKPDHLGFEEAAGMLLPYLTAYFTLKHLGQMSAGERVLIHAGAGGVGLAAIKLAQQAGAEIFATAGNVEKRAYLKSLGIRHVLDSRSVDFPDEIMRITEGEGVNLVLNSLADEFCQKSLAILAKNGRFLEIGKRGILDPGAVKQQRPDVSYFVVDWSETNKEEPALMQALLLKVMDGIVAGSLPPLPYRVFPLEHAVAAFRFMAQARHIGKIIVTQQASKPRQTLSSMFRSKASYLITGGLGGLGLVLARWMAEKGARHLVLVGHNEPSDTARAAINAIEVLGTQVTVAQADVAVAEQLTHVFHNIKETGLPPLRGVFHLAGSLDNGVLLQQDWSRFSKVLAPKVNGAWNLHTLTKNLSLDFFVMFSSVASLLGSRGQGNHAAANMFMDNLAYYRRAEGLPAISLNWGAWSEIGAAAKDDTLAWITEQGMGTINPELGLQVMEELFAEPSPQMGVAPINWSSFLRGSRTSGSMSSFFTEVIQQAQIKQVSVQTPEKKAPEMFLTKLQAAPVNKRRPLLISYVQEQTRKVLGLDAGQDVYEQVPLSQLGLDSLMAVELRNVLSAGLGLKRTLPATLVFDYPTVEAISNHLLTEINLTDIKPQDGPIPAERKQVQMEDQILPGILDTLEGLSEEEAEEIFAKQMLRGNGKHE